MYQILLTDQPDSTVSCTVQTFNTQREQWLDLDHWTVTVATAARRASQLRSAARQHGWSLDAPATSAHTLPVEPLDWATIVERAGQRKQQVEQAAADADFAWRQVVIDTPRKGSDGYIPAEWIARAAGLSRHRVFEIIRNNG